MFFCSDICQFNIQLENCPYFEEKKNKKNKKQEIESSLPMHMSIKNCFACNIKIIQKYSESKITSEVFNKRNIESILYSFGYIEPIPVIFG